MTDQEKAAMQFLEDSSADYIARLLVSCPKLSEEQKEAIRTVGPLIYIQGAAQVFATYDCYFKS